MTGVIMKKKKVIIVGAGPGGLACGMILQKNGYDVVFYEKQSYVGGRNGSLNIGEFTFDIGPTFFMMKNVLEDIFQLSGNILDEHCKFERIEPMYRLAFRDKTFFPYTDDDRMLPELERVFPGSTSGYLKYLNKEKKKYDKLIPCLQIPYGKMTDFFRKNFRNSIPYLDAHVSLYDVLGRYFKEDDLKISFTFQAKYIGMSPWEAPGTFSIISYIEHGGGIYHIMGGLNSLSKAMARIVCNAGAKIHLSTPVKQLIVENGVAKGVELSNGNSDFADIIVINADFANAMSKIISTNDRKKYTDEKLNKMKYSCSTFMLYLALDKIYDSINHHNIFFADDYKKNVEEIINSKILPEDPSFYIQNASITDSSLAPSGKSAVYVLVPIANTTGNINWQMNRYSFQEKILDYMEKKAGMKDIRKHIEGIKVITPDDWKNSFDVFNGATFNLGHGIDQMLYFRPHNQFEEFENCYLVGGGTHPGSGLPTIYESGKISANLIMENN